VYISTAKFLIKTASGKQGQFQINNASELIKDSGSSATIS